MTEELIPNLKQLSAKIRMMWGQHPDANLVDEAIAALEAANAPAEAEAQATKAPRKKKAD